MLVIQHEPGEGLGTLARHLGEPRIVRTYAGDAVPADADALVVLGGGMCVRDQDRLPHLRDEIRLLQRCLAQGRPVLGICLGSQLLAAALGAEVGPARAKEIGFYSVRLLPAARQDPLFGAAPEKFVAFHWHGDAFARPRGAGPLAGSALTPLQAFRFGERAWGIQFHLETDEPLLRAMIEAGTAELAESGLDPDQLLAQSRRELPRLGEVAGTVFTRWSALCSERQ